MSGEVQYLFNQALSRGEQLRALAEELRAKGGFNIYEKDGLVFRAYPGQEAVPGGGRAEHMQGDGKHFSIRDSTGREVRISAETFKPLTANEAKQLTPQMSQTLSQLNAGEQKFLSRATDSMYRTGRLTGGQIDYRVRRLIPSVGRNQD